MNLRAIFERTNEDYTWTVLPDFFSSLRLVVVVYTQTEVVCVL